MLTAPGVLDAGHDAVNHREDLKAVRHRVFVWVGFVETGREASAEQDAFFDSFHNTNRITWDEVEVILDRVVYAHSAPC